MHLKRVKQGLLAALLTGALSFAPVVASAQGFDFGADDDSGSEGMDFGSDSGMDFGGSTTEIAPIDTSSTAYAR